MRNTNITRTILATVAIALSASACGTGVLDDMQQRGREADTELEDQAIAAIVEIANVSAGCGAAADLSIRGALPSSVALADFCSAAEMAALVDAMTVVGAALEG